jgi:hypothetical protein
MNENHVKNGIALINNFLFILDDSSKTNEDKKEALQGIHATVKTFGRNYDYADFMIELGKNKNNHEDSIPKSIILAKDFVRRLEKHL